MRKVRIAQIGINRYSHGPDIFLTMKALEEVYEIAGYTLVEDEAITCADKLHVFDGYSLLTLNEILEDSSIEAVAVETDEIHLLKYANLAADYGKHIHMEKPGSPSLTDFDALVRKVKLNGTVFHIGYMYRYNPYIADAVKSARSGELGTVFSAEAQMSRHDNEETRRWLSSLPGGMMFYLGCHLVDLILQIRRKPERIIPLNRASEPGRIEAKDYAMAVLEYPNGVSFVKTSCAELGGGSRRQLVINGTKGSIEIQPLETFTGKGFTLRSSRKITDKMGNVRKETSEIFDRYQTMMTSFAAMVRGELQNPYSPDYERFLFATLLSCCGTEE